MTDDKKSACLECRFCKAGKAKEKAESADYFCVWHRRNVYAIRRYGCPAHRAKDAERTDKANPPIYWEDVHRRAKGARRVEVSE